jgi:hypothetical protein
VVPTLSQRTRKNGAPFAVVVAAAACLSAPLLRLHDFVDHYLAALVGSDDFVDGSVSAERNVDHIVAGIEGYVDWRTFIQHALIDGDLGALGLGANGDQSLAGLRALSAEQFRHLTAHGLDVVGVAERTQGGREVEGLPLMVSSM